MINPKNAVYEAAKYTSQLDLTDGERQAATAAYIACYASLTSNQVDPTEPLPILPGDLTAIIAFAMGEHRERPSFNAMSPREVQFICIIAGLERYMYAKGRTPNFSIPPFKR